MTKPKEDKQFNETLKRMMDAKPKPHEEMKKGRRAHLPKKDMPPPPSGENRDG